MGELEWHDLEIRFRITAASIVAISESSPPLVRQNMELLFSEGRSFTIDPADEDGAEVESLTYDTFLWDAGYEYPEEWSGSEAQIIITGHHENGSLLDIRGQGFIGETLGGGIGVSFEGPPQIRVSRAQG